MKRKNLIIVTSFDSAHLNESDKYTYFNISDYFNCAESCENFHYININLVSLFCFFFINEKLFIKYFYKHRILHIFEEK